MNRQDEYITNNFTWFIGEVLDINDAVLYARVKVRAYGYYDESVPAEKLPWATVLLPNTSASKEGVGSTHGLLVGSWVVGFFRDGPSAQDPVIIGSIPTQTNEVKDIPIEAHVENIKNKVHKTESGHVIEFDDTADAERINIKHKSGTTVLIDKDGGVHISSINDTVTIKGNTTITGTLHATGDISTDAGNAPTLATHTHKEKPGSGDPTDTTEPDA
tara:strand:- start:6334 stop:6984 length:651 start_codon:yes stop_codon:yes gene_type:complete